jgi:putative transposase
VEISDEVLDALLGGAKTAEEIAGPDGLLGQLTRRLLNRALEAELAEHLGYEAGHAPPGGAGNARNGKPGKTVLTDQGPLRIRSPRDRKGTFEPQLVRKRQTRWVGFDEKVISLYARGLTVREIQGHLAEIYGTEVSPDQSRRSPTPSWRTPRRGRTGRWSVCTRSCTSTHWSSRSAMGTLFETTPAMWRSA